MADGTGPTGVAGDNARSWPRVNEPGDLKRNLVLRAPVGAISSAVGGPCWGRRPAGRAAV